MSTATASRPLWAGRCSTPTESAWTKVYKRVCELAEHDPASWQPAPLLKRLAEAGRTFNQG